MKWRPILVLAFLGLVASSAGAQGNLTPPQTLKHDASITGAGTAPSPAGVHVATGGGLTTGGGTTGVSLLTTCASGQTLQWSGSAWACADNASTVAGTQHRVAVFTDASHVGDSSTLWDSGTSVGADTTTPVPTFALDITTPTRNGIHLQSNSHGSSGEQPTILWTNDANQVRSFFTSEGQYYTNGFMTISGGVQGTWNPTTGAFAVSSLGLPTSEPTMLAVMADVAGPTMVVRGSGDVGNYLFEGMDVAGHTTFKIEDDGTLKWGAGALAAVDTNLYRNAAGSLMTDSIFTSNKEIIVEGGAGTIPLTLVGNAAVHIEMDAAAHAKTADIGMNTNGEWDFINNASSNGNVALYGNGQFIFGDQASFTTRFSIASSTGDTNATGKLSGASVLTGGASGSKWSRGAGIPAISCAQGDLFSRTDGGVGTTLYDCTSTNTWTASTSTAPLSGLTTGTLPVATSSSTLADSIIAQSGGTATITGNLTETGATVLSGIQTTSTLGNDFALNASTTTLLVTGTSLTLTGLTGGTNGRMLWIVNKSGANRTIVSNNSGSSSAGNKIFTLGATGYIPDTGAMQLEYDTDHWRVVSVASNYYQDFTVANSMNVGGNAYLQQASLSNVSYAAWSSTSATSGTPDVALYRNAAGVLEINNGTAGTWRDLKLRNLVATGTGEIDSTLDVTGSIYAGAGTTGGLNFDDTTASDATSYINNAGYNKTTTYFRSLYIEDGKGNTSGHQIVLFNAPTKSFTTYGQILGGGTTPTLTGCGTSPTIVGTDDGGIVTPDGNATACTIHWNQTWPHKPSVTLTPTDTGTMSITADSTTDTTVTDTTWTGFVPATPFHYHSFGY